MTSQPEYTMRSDEACDHDDDALILEGFDHALGTEEWWTCTSCGATVRYVGGVRRA